MTSPWQFMTSPFHLLDIGKKIASMFRKVNRQIFVSLTCKIVAISFVVRLKTKKLGNSKLRLRIYFFVFVFHLRVSFLGVGRVWSTWTRMARKRSALANQGQDRGMVCCRGS